MQGSRWQYRHRFATDGFANVRIKGTLLNTECQ
jgi:hypothetical protein